MITRKVLYYPRVHVYGVSAATHDKAQTRLRRRGQIIESTTVANKFAAIALKQEILARVDEHRCIAPKQLVPISRTETWRELGGPTTIRRPLEVAVVRFAGLKADRHLVDQVQATHPGIRLLDHHVRTPAEACQALTQPADLVILASRGWTRHTWGKGPPLVARRALVRRRPRRRRRRHVPDGSRRRSGRGRRPAHPRARSRRPRDGRTRSAAPAGAGATQVLIPAHARRGPAHVDELIELIATADRNRDDPRQATAGLTRYVPA